MKSKACKKCKLIKSITEFSISNPTKHFYKNECNKCEKQNQIRIKDYHVEVNNLTDIYKIDIDKYKVKRQQQFKLDVAEILNQYRIDIAEFKYKRLESFRKERAEYQQDYTKKG